MVLRKVPKTGISSLTHKARIAKQKYALLVIYRRQLKFDKNDKVCYEARKKSM